MASVRDKSVAPSEGWHFYIPETDYTVRAPSYSTLLSAVARHCKSNGIGAPTVAEIEQFLCDNTTIRCRDDNGKPYQNRYVNRRNWPLYLRGMKLLAKEGDRGLGDVVARVVGPIGGDAYKKWAHKTIGGCGCYERQQDWNTEYPL